MANEEHLEILKQGTDVWNEWREKHSAIELDLSHVVIGDMDLRGANLGFADLSGTNLKDARLSFADFSHGNLTGANFNGANITGANLTGADLTGADLSFATLSHARLSRALLNGASLNHARLSFADLSFTNLTGTDLSFADLSHADLRNAHLDLAFIYGTLLSNLDLRDVTGLEEVRHGGPSDISVSTIDRSDGQIPEIFLRGCGLRDWEIEASKLYRTDLSRNQTIEVTYKVIELRSDPLIQFNSCFISYSSKDEEFTSPLYSDLQGSGVRCWFAPEHMKIGDRIRDRLDDTIRLQDKLLLVLSEASVTSQWIEQEVETALEKEREQGCEVLSPIRLDDAVMKINKGWPALIRKTRHIGDFSRWEDPDQYKKAFERLLNDLRVDA